MVKIEAPDRHYNGRIGSVTFENGVAETDDPAVIQYCQSAGYTVGGQVLNPPAVVAQVDSRDATGQIVGNRLRDAAVDPRAGDFLAPVNAGQADPHGPEVVSPEIHANPGPTPIVPGLVSDDPAVQQAREAESAQRVLVDQEPVPEVTADLAKANTVDGQEQPEAPAGNASQADWADWVLATHSGLDAEKVRGMKRDELREQFGPKEA